MRVRDGVRRDGRGWAGHHPRPDQGHHHPWRQERFQRRVVQQVLAHCHEQLADFKIPQYIVVSGGPLPRNPGGKLLKAQWRKSVEWGAPL
jgi:acyl-CoA synthetase (AMP-forming)/AMP-acid ligase II